VHPSALKKIGLAGLFAAALFTIGCTDVSGPGAANDSQNSNPKVTLISSQDSTATDSVTVGKVGTVTVVVTTPKTVLQ